MTQGIALALALLLVSAGLPKLWRPEHVARALRRVFGPRRPSTPALRLFGRLLGLWELVLAAGIVVIGGVVVGVAVAVTFVGFLGFVLVAVRRGASCGCWASLTEGPAGGAEVARTGVLAAGAVIVAVSGWSPIAAGSRHDHVLGLAAVGWAAVFLAFTWLVAVVGGWAVPVSSPRVARRLALRAAPTRRGRVLARLGFLLGFVHTGTEAERRRYLGALAAQAMPRPDTAPVARPSGDAQNASA